MIRRRRDRRRQRAVLDVGALAGAVFGDDTGQWISDAEVAETTYTAFATTRHKVTARLIVRRVREKNPAPAGQEELFATWRITRS